MPATIVSDARDIGALIATERKRQGLTQAELAGFSGVGVTFLSQLENGKGTAELDKALTVLATLGIDLVAQRRGA